MAFSGGLTKGVIIDRKGSSESEPAPVRTGVRTGVRPGESSRAPLRTAVVGTGYLGRFHAQKYAALPDCELVAVCDPDGARGAAIADEVGTRALDDHRALVELDGGCDAVSIASPTRSHFGVARDCLERGLHVLVEKPMTTTVEEARELVALAAERELVLQVGHLERFNPALVSVADLITAPTFVESHRLAPFTQRGTDVDVVLDLMIHDIDIILHLVPSALEAIHANGAKVISEATDIASVRLEFADGCVANVTASRVSGKRERRMRFFQKDRYVAIDFQESTTRVCTVNRAGTPDSNGVPPIECTDADCGKGDAILAEIEAFLYAVRSGTRPLVSGEDGLRALETAIRIGERLRGATARASGAAS